MSIIKLIPKIGNYGEKKGLRFRADDPCVIVNEYKNIYKCIENYT